MSSAPAPQYREWAECAMPADLAAIAPTLRLIRDHLAARGLLEDSWNSLELALAEALNNAVEHGCKEHPGETIHVRWHWTDEWLELSVRDPGNFRPSPTWRELPEDPLAERGRGGFLIASTMDVAAHFNDDRGHTLLLKKRLGLIPHSPTESAAMERELEHMTRELSDSYESLTALLRLTELLAASASFHDFLQEMLVRLRTIVHADEGYAWFCNAAGEWTLNEFNRTEATSSPFRPSPTALEYAAFDLKREHTVEDASTLPEGDPLRAMKGGVFVCPIRFRAQTLGVLVTARRTGDYFAARELNLVRTVADFVAIVRAISDLQMQREAQLKAVRELEIAAEIQQSLLPRRFPVDGPFQIHGTCMSAQAVGGDYFDVVELPDKSVFVVIADVMGKGLSAALLAATLRSSLRARIEFADRPDQLLSEVNRQLAEDLGAVDMFITAQLAHFNPATRRVRLANAGHCKALRLGAGPTTLVSTESGPPLGVLRDVAYKIEEHELATGDALLFITDGLYEVEGDDAPMLGIDGLARIAEATWRGEPRAFCAELLGRIQGRKQARAQDDRTLVVVKAVFPT